MNIPLPPLSWLALVAALFGLLCVLRFSLYLGIIERPISVAAIWGLCTGEWALALPLGIFFELFWMDLLGAGTYIPPNANLPLLLCLFTQHTLSASPAGVPLILIILALPTAFMATHLEQWHRKNQIHVHDQFVEDGKMEAPVNTRVIASSILKLWAMETVLFVGLAIVLFWLCAGTNILFIQLFSPLANPLANQLDITWPTLWLVAALGGILSLRTKRSMVALGVTLLILCIMLLRTQIQG